MAARKSPPLFFGGGGGGKKNTEIFWGKKSKIERTFSTTRALHRKQSFFKGCPMVTTPVKKETTLFDKEAILFLYACISCVHRNFPYDWLQCMQS